MAYSIARRGLGARTEPSQVEEFLARTMRRLATPREVRSLTSPWNRRRLCSPKGWSTSPITVQAATRTTAAEIPKSGAVSIRARLPCAQVRLRNSRTVSVPTLTADEIARMEQLNPKTAEQ